MVIGPLGVALFLVQAAATTAAATTGMPVAVPVTMQNAPIIAPVIQVGVPIWLSMAVVSCLLGIGITWGTVTSRLAGVERKVGEVEIELRGLTTRAEVDGLSARLTESLGRLHDDIREIRKMGANFGKPV